MSNATMMMDSEYDDSDQSTTFAESILPAAIMLGLWLWPWIFDAVLGRLGGFGWLPLQSLLPACHAQLAGLKVVASRLMVAAFCGSVIGLERKDADRPAGLRSMTLVSCGSALYTLACMYGPGFVGSTRPGDPMRAAAQVCTGIGFIGAGVIAKGSIRDPVRGVTTACAVWVSSALGVVAASGMWLFALYSCGLTVTVLRISRWYNRLVGTRLAGLLHLPPTVDAKPVYPVPKS